MAKQHSKMSGVHWAWIGATRPNSESTNFSWNNGKAMNFTRWRNGCPDNRQGENCVLMTVFRDRTSHWCNFKCDTNHDHVICEKPFTKSSQSESQSPTQSPNINVDSITTKQAVNTDSNSPCDAGWENFENKCFKFHNANVTGDQARHVCKYEHNASMVSIHTEAEHAFLVEYLFYENGAQDAVWIGLRRNSDNSSDWHWVNNKKANYFNWGFNEPDNRHVAGPENCVILNDVKPNYGRWVDVPCHLDFLLVCERNSKNVASSTDSQPTEIPNGVNTNTIESGNKAEQSKLESHTTATNTCSHGVWLALLSISVVLLFASLVILGYFYRKKINKDLLYSSTSEFANVHFDGRSHSNDYNQDIGIGIGIPEQSHYSEVTYAPNQFGSKFASVK
ncbi:macrophage mannose receptor 1-like protein [Leptotrombidium deliense]|uniref:Macrophage mannose receptor 1-like protein n=1 Tax=Leptotrombidium deliense TaxID=299467 RepID=A0A443SAI0_9ACAR|nr:macrophage mannose receptor 1-like protein [Leptotrombidium deliense]